MPNGENSKTIMKTGKELGEVLLDNQELFIHGLCDWVMKIKRKRLITWDEAELIIKTLHNNKPKDILNGEFYWVKGDIEPRLEWIKGNLK